MRITLLGLAVVATLVACGGGNEASTDSAEVNAPARDTQVDAPAATTDSAAATTATTATDASAPVEQKDPDLCGTTPEGTFTATGLSGAFAGLEDAWEVRATLAAGAAADAPFGLTFTTPTTSKDDARNGESGRART